MHMCMCILLSVASRGFPCTFRCPSARAHVHVHFAYRRMCTEREGPRQSIKSERWKKNLHRKIAKIFRGCVLMNILLLLSARALFVCKVLAGKETSMHMCICECDLSVCKACLGQQMCTHVCAHGARACAQVRVHMCMCIWLAKRSEHA